MQEGIENPIDIDDMYRTFSEKSGNVLFARFYKLLNIIVGIYFLSQSHCTGVSHNLLDNRLVDTAFC